MTHIPMSLQREIRATQYNWPRSRFIAAAVVRVAAVGNLLAVAV